MTISERVKAIKYGPPEIKPQHLEPRDKVPLNKRCSSLKTFIDPYVSTRQLSEGSIRLAKVGLMNKSIYSVERKKLNADNSIGRLSNYPKSARSYKSIASFNSTLNQKP
jgi:hypothetical protein